MLYSLMDVFVLPSHREGFPVSVMEASAIGLPCIVTNVRGCREAIEHEYNGLVVPLGDVPALADAILDLLTNRDKAQKMAETGKRVALRDFDERRVFKIVETEYARLIEDAMRSRGSATVLAHAPECARAGGSPCHSIRS